MLPHPVWSRFSCFQHPMLQLFQPLRSTLANRLQFAKQIKDMAMIARKQTVFPNSKDHIMFAKQTESWSEFAKSLSFQILYERSQRTRSTPPWRSSPTSIFWALVSRVRPRSIVHTLPSSPQKALPLAPLQSGCQAKWSNTLKTFFGSSS